MTIIAALILFSIIVLIHELGHFIFAKRSGIKVNEFSIGMGPKIYSVKKDTEYSIRALPIGGYVSMEGEDEEQISPNSFGNKSILQRFSTIVAGPIFNIILAAVLLVPVFLYIGSPTTTLGKIMQDTPAQAVGLQVGDKINKINGNSVKTWDEVANIINTSSGGELKLSITRDGNDKVVNVIPKDNNGKYEIGIQPQREKDFFGSIVNACKTTVDMTKQMLTFLGQMVTGRVPGGIGNAVAGPVGVIGMVSDAAQTGLINVVYLAAVISLNLGIVNLLPIPALDGWRILMLLLEAVRGGKKLDPNKEGMINVVGFGALMLFMLFITYKDILRLFQ
ncbi:MULTISPECIES: RIP metalloprotease RseP [unclassified Clostridioides]|uniref:RIP metalloprotease RseP n=1 Tax=unclassified Clostridioides TaxID=2635829 RepID=UPI001D0C9B47|nr:RIP metalloprotease RseP [Clostridioides sp. ES-S-0001-02]MCC0673535.1 RIP metalloprotease RseP [Clostridioides sp. ES-S-0145-01]MCC0695076.1 RIP metalloprotease RseP [Clostridioides sp. ES-S-0048-02]MCC0702112.1 RIP metalloprotease RseP [Clostridioides sp. ES-S-0049-02]MCC0763751.1 RIP metalloprotease RseP [Clostridioides sp. ES-S-0006-03]UDN60439.1 RIP metalloprotease RseP [Clostridioides sp. ES-W-0016-02]